MNDRGVPGSPEGEPDPLGELFRSLFGSEQSGLGMEALRNFPGLAPLGNDPATLQALVAHMQHMLASAGDDPVNWTVAHDVARQAAAADGDPSMGQAEHRQTAEALRTADLWLDRVTDLPSATARIETWSRAEWVENTLPVWRTIVEPVARRVGEALATTLREQAPEEFRAGLAGALPMLHRMGGVLFGTQVGQALGTLAQEVVSAGDIGLPLLGPGRAALLPSNLTSFGEGLGLGTDEVRLYMALREAAHARLFSGVPWLRAHLLAALDDYARGISIDTAKIERAVQEISVEELESLQEALASGLFEPERTEAQQAALNRLELGLALVEGWVDQVVDAAASGTLPHAAALRETVRRRRATGGPAEHTFAALVGLHLRPRRLREASALWQAMAEQHGPGGRDSLWQHPDLLPTSQALADPAAFARQAGGPGVDAPDAMDEALAALLDEEKSGGDDSEGA
ncbi:MAG: hypothetical protein QG608_2341 [Actinomycetota bacterium]|nr:hypothetical protein [Actinomycetota bacterium]